MNIQVDQDKCVGAGQCVMTAPEVFDQRKEDGIVELLDDAPPQSLWAVSREAAMLCPSGAIQIRET